MKSILKSITWQILAFLTSQLLGRVWFGNWQVSWFIVVLCLTLIPIYWVHDRIWRKTK